MVDNDGWRPLSFPWAFLTDWAWLHLLQKPGNDFSQDLPRFNSKRLEKCAIGKNTNTATKIAGDKITDSNKKWYKKLAQELWSAIENVANFSYNIRDQSHHKMRNINSFKNEIISRRHLLQ